MAKRAPEEEREFNPIQATLIQAAVGPARPTSQAAGPKELPAVVDKDVATATEEPAATPIKPPRQQRFLMSWEDEQTFGALTHELSEAVGTPVKLSNVLRSCVMLIRHSEEEIVRNAGRAGPLTRPANNDQVAMTMFEHRIAQILQVGFREAKHLT